MRNSKKSKAAEEFIDIIKKLQNIGVDTNKLVQVDTIESLAEKSGIDKEKIKEIGLDLDYKIGMKKKSIIQAYRRQGTGRCIPPTEEQVNKLKELGISLEKRDVIEEFIEIIEKLRNIGVDTNKLVSTDTIESLAEKSGIDKEKIKEARLDPNYKIGQKRFLIAQACKGKGTYAKPNEKQVKELEQLGILRKDNSLTKKSKVIDKFIEVIEKLQNIRVDTNKLVSTDTIESLAKKSGIDEEKIKEAGLDLNYKIGMKKKSIIQAYRRQGTGRCIPPTEEQVNKLKELGIFLEKVTR